MASGIFYVFKDHLMKKLLNLNTAGDTINVALMGSAYPGSVDFSSATYAAISGSEMSGTGYSTGGTALSGQSVSSALGTTTFTGSNTAWGSAASFTAYGAVLYDVTDSNSLICWFDFGGGKTVSNGTFTIQWNASGIITLS